MDKTPLGNPPLWTLHVCRNTAENRWFYRAVLRRRWRTIVVAALFPDNGEWIRQLNEPDVFVFRGMEKYLQDVPTVVEI